MKSSENIGEIAAALCKAQAAMGAVTKGSDNPFFKSSYADINAVIATIKASLNENGISYLQPPKVIEVAGEKLTVIETILLHTSGQFISSETEVKAKDNNDPQKYGAGITYARRFGLQSLVGLPAEDDDGNKASGVGSKGKTSRAAKKTASKPASPSAAKEESGDQASQPAKKKGGFRKKKAQV
jgi:hypothetical protein